MIPIGILMKKFRRQSISVRNPPRIGPTTNAAAMIMERIPMALPSSHFGNASTTMTVPFATRNAPPIACITRKPISCVTSAARPQRSDPNVNTTMPMT